MGNLRHVFAAVPLALVLTGCGGGGHPRDVVFGQTAPEALSRTRGEPVVARRSDLRPEATVHQFRDRSSCQAEGGAVVACAREPRGAERTLQYWRHLLKGSRTEYRPIAGSRDTQGLAQYQLIAPERGLTVVYDRALERVVRVMEYAPARR